MVTTFTTPDSQEAHCPSCGAKIKVPGRRRRVQCPKCREVVTIEEAAAAAAPARLPKPPPPVAAPPDDEPARISALEVRISALEGRMKQPPIAPRSAAPVPEPEPVAVPPPARTVPEPEAPPPATPAPAGLWWVTGDDAQLLDITPAQEAALLHNLGALAGQTLTIRTISGNPFARKRAEALKAIFERAGWTVRGVEEIPRTHAEPGLTLAVGTLPVEKEAATTFLALKAAGLAVVPVLDPALASLVEEEPPQLSLTIAPGRTQ